MKQLEKMLIFTNRSVRRAYKRYERRGGLGADERDHWREAQRSRNFNLIHGFSGNRMPERGRWRSPKKEMFAPPK